MGLSHLYADFGGRRAKARTKGKHWSDTELEDLKLTAFEQGFAAGWEDAVKAHEDGQSTREDEILEALRDTGFSIAEARRAMTEALEPLYAEICAKLLPALGRAGFPQHVVEQLKKMTAASIDQPVELQVPAEAAAQIEDLLESGGLDTLTVVPVEGDTGLVARIRVAGQECEVDMQRLVQEIETTMKTAMHTLKEEPAHG